MVSPATVQKMAVQHECASGPSCDDALVGMPGKRLRKSLGQRARDEVRPRHYPRRAILFGEVVEHPKRSEHNVRIVWLPWPPVRVQALLTKARQRIASMQVCHVMGSGKDVTRGCNERWMAFECSPRFDLRRRLVDGDVLCATGLRRSTVECTAQARHPLFVERKWHHDVAVAVQRATPIRNPGQ